MTESFSQLLRTIRSDHVVLDCLRVAKVLEAHGDFDPLSHRVILRRLKTEEDRTAYSKAFAESGLEYNLARAVTSEPANEPSEEEFKAYLLTNQDKIQVGLERLRERRRLRRKT